MCLCLYLLSIISACSLSRVISLSVCLSLRMCWTVFLKGARVCVNTLMSETIVSFSKASFSFVFIRQLSTPLGQSFRVWRLRISTPPRQAEFGRYVYARAYFQFNIFLRVSSFGVPVQMWGNYSDSQLSTYLHLCPIYCKSTNLIAGFHRCLLPPANAFRQK